MSKILYRWGRSAAQHPWRMLFAWLVVVIAVVGLKSSIGGSTSDNFKIPGTESQQGIDLLNDRFPSQGGSSGQVVFADPDGDVTDAVARATIGRRSARSPTTRTWCRSAIRSTRVRTVSADGRIAYATVRYSVDPPAKSEGEAAKAAVETAREAGLQAELSRNIVRTADEAQGNEGIGLIVAVIVLLVAFGSVIAAGIPIGTALFGIFIGLSIIGIMAGFTDVPSVSPMLATMIGLGVGIDYALFVVTRHRAFLHEGRSVVESVGLANATAGSAVLFAGTTVVIAIAGLRIAGIPAIATMGFASAITVAVAMARCRYVAACLPRPRRPAHRLVAHRSRSDRRTSSRSQTVAGRWADHVGSHPWRYAIVSFVGLVALAGPVLSMRTGIADDGTGATEHTYRKAYDLLAEGFGEGFNASADDRGRWRRWRGQGRSGAQRRSLQPTASPRGGADRQPGRRHRGDHRLSRHVAARREDRVTGPLVARRRVAPGAPRHAVAGLRHRSDARPSSTSASGWPRGSRSSSVPSSVCRSCC